VIIICTECGARSDDPDGHGPTCRAAGGWRDWGPPPPPPPPPGGEVPDELARLLRAAARLGELGEQEGELGGERAKRLLHDGISLLRLLGDYQRRP
jgi:hypothetical protein